VLFTCSGDKIHRHRVGGSTSLRICLNALIASVWNANKKLCVIWLFLNVACLTHLIPDSTVYYILSSASETGALNPTPSRCDISDQILTQH
jgi:hypothetical protein